MNETNVMYIIRDLLTHPTRKILVINGLREQAFPIDEVQAFFTLHPEIGQRIREFEMRGFWEDNSAQLLGLIVRNFSNLTRIKFKHRQTVQDHLPKFARLTKLEILELNLDQPDLEVLTSMTNIASFTNVRQISLKSTYDDKDVLAGFYPSLFPNIEFLYVYCNHVRIRGQALAQATNSVFPKLDKLCLVVPQSVCFRFLNPIGRGFDHFG